MPKHRVTDFIRNLGSSKFFFSASYARNFGTGVDPEGDVFKHTKLLLKQLKNPPVDLAFGALLHDVGKPPTFKRADRIRFNGHDRVGARMADEILTRLRFSNDLKDRIVACVDGHMRFKDVKQMKDSTLKKFMQRDTFDTELEQHRIDCLASHGDISNWRFLKKKLKTLSREEIKPAPLLGGRDLLEVGYKPGPLFGKILKRLEIEQLEGRLKSKEEGISFVKKKYPIS